MNRKILTAVLTAALGGVAVGCYSSSYPFQEVDVSYQLAVLETQGFDFRDENNNSTPADTALVRNLFLGAAWNLLALGKTLPRASASALLAESARIGEFSLKMFKALKTVLFVLNSRPERLEKPARAAATERFLASQGGSSLIKNFVHVTFGPAFQPLRL